ncbi:nucleoside monophosphate kinase [candidate division WOR-3 bacterium]|nr:nucleoside monophosphate kinase [candidate division WOR-3 bacterium]
MRIEILLGPPGAGKGTMAAYLSRCAGLSVFVTGDVLRQAISSGSELGQRVKVDVEQGRLVDDETILNLVKKFLTEHSEGVIFDGFPRTLRQAEDLRAILDPADELRVIHLDTSAETVVARLSARRMCPQCGRIYNLRFKPPLTDELCDECNTRLIQRKDDTEVVIKERYRIYLKETAPLVGYFADVLMKVDGNAPADVVFRELKEELCPG